MVEHDGESSAPLDVLQNINAEKTSKDILDQVKFSIDDSDDANTIYKKITN